MEEQTRSADAQEEEPWDEDEELRKVSQPNAAHHNYNQLHAPRQRPSVLRPTRKSLL